MIKVEFWPSGLNKSLFELKPDKGEWTLLLTKEAFEEEQDQGQIWVTTGIEELSVLEIFAQTVAAVSEEFAPAMRVISGGTSISIKGNIDGKAIAHRFLAEEAGPQGQKFAQSLIGLAWRSIADEKCHAYLKALSACFN